VDFNAVVPFHILEEKRKFPLGKVYLSEMQTEFALTQFVTGVIFAKREDGTQRLCIE